MFKCDDDEANKVMSCLYSGKKVRRVNKKRLNQRAFFENQSKKIEAQNKYVVVVVRLHVGATRNNGVISTKEEVHNTRGTALGCDIVLLQVLMEVPNVNEMFVQVRSAMVELKYSFTVRKFVDKNKQECQPHLEQKSC